MKTIINDLSKETIAKIAESHKRRFENLLASESRNVRRGECEHYLAVWSLVAAHNGDGVPLEPEGRNELCEALFCGDYDPMLTPEELDKVEAWRDPPPSEV